MSFSGSTIIDVQNGGSDSANGGAFDPGNANFATDLAATVANTSSPVVTSASYTFVSTDVGAWLFIQAGSNWTPGWYQIASIVVSPNSATLTAGVGTAYLAGFGASPCTFPSSLNTVAGCATTASPTGGTWGIDYSQGTSPTFSYTDMVIDGTTNTKFTSSAHPVGPNIVGNLIAVTSGSGFTVQTVQVSSVSGTTATCDKSLGTLSSTGGHGGLGGSVATFGQASKLANGLTTNGAYCFIKYNATPFAVGATINVAAGAWAPGKGVNICGWQTTRTINNTDATRPTLQCSANAVTMILIPSASGVFWVRNLILDGNTHTTCVGVSLASTGGNLMYVINCKMLGLATGLTNANAWSTVDRCEFNACTTAGLASTGVAVTALHSTALTCGTGFNCTSDNTTLSYCVATGCTTAGISVVNSRVDHCTAQGTTGGPGFELGNSQNYMSNCLSYNNSTVDYHQTAARQGQILEKCAGATLSTTFAAGQLTGFVTLTADPFTNKSASPPDLSLNNLSGGGILCRGTAVPSSPVGLGGASNSDIGAYQSAGPTYFAG